MDAAQRNLLDELRKLPRMDRDQYRRDRLTLGEYRILSDLDTPYRRRHRLSYKTLCILRDIGRRRLGQSHPAVVPVNDQIIRITNPQPRGNHHDHRQTEVPGAG